MSRSEDKLIQYLNEAHATEVALVTTLRAHIAMTPRGTYRLILERHLDETRGHAQRLEQRLGELGAGRSLVASGVGLLESLVGQALSMTKGPIDALRGGSGEEKLLKNAKDECATEALEIATYDAIETLARELDDEETAELAVLHRLHEERMLERLRQEIPRLTRAVVGAELYGDGSYDVRKTGAADALRGVGREVRDALDDATERARGAAQEAAAGAAVRAERVTERAKGVARRIPGEQEVEGQVRAAVESEDDFPIPGYDDLRVSDVLAALPQLGQAELSEVDAYERRGRARKTILAKIDSLHGGEPWTDYDDLSVEEIEDRLEGADEETRTRVRDYERRHRARQEVIAATGPVPTAQTRAPHDLSSATGPAPTTGG